MTDTRQAPPDLNAAAIESALAAQGIALAPGRADKMVTPLAGAIAPALADPLHAGLGFDHDPVGHALAVARCVASNR